MARKNSPDGPGDFTQLFDMLEDQQATSLLGGVADTAPVEWEPTIIEMQPAPRPAPLKVTPTVAPPQAAPTAAPPQAAPTAAPPKAAPRIAPVTPPPPAPPRDYMVILIAALVSFIILVCGGTLTWVITSNRTPPTVVQPTVTVTETVTTTTTVTQTPPPTAEQNEESVALAALTAQVQADAGAVQQRLQNQWTTQLSARKQGLILGGLVWTYQGIWDEYTNLRDAYPEALLVQPSAYRSFNLGADWYVIVSGIEFHNANAALDWCDNQGLADDDCFAVRVTNDRGKNNQQHR